MRKYYLIWKGKVSAIRVENRREMLDKMIKGEVKADLIFTECDWRKGKDRQDIYRKQAGRIKKKIWWMFKKKKKVKKK